MDVKIWYVKELDGYKMPIVRHRHKGDLPFLVDPPLASDLSVLLVLDYVEIMVEDPFAKIFRSVNIIRIHFVSLVIIVL